MSAIAELARFLGISEVEAKRRVKNYHPNQMAEQWGGAKHETAEQVKDFYKGVDKYLYELIPWNESDVFYQRIAPLLHYRNKRILEIGAGIGSLCISLALNENDVTYFDINKTLEAFAKQRFADRLLPIKITDSLVGERDYDIIVAIDLLEHIHIDDLLGLLKDIAGCLKDGGFFYHRSNFHQQDLFPMHYDHSAVLVELAEKAGLVQRENGDFVKGAKTYGVQIGIPLKDSIHRGSLTRCLMDLEAPQGTILTTCENYPVDLARNKIAAQLHKDWLFFMDSDQTFPRDALKQLMSWNVDIVAGLTFKRTGEPVPMFYKYIYEQGRGHYYQPMTMEVGEYLTKHKDLLKDNNKGALCLPPYALLEIDGCSAGCLLINKRVFDAIDVPDIDGMKQYFQCDEGTKAGEDFYFCRKAQEAGFKIYGDPSVICGHYSEYIRTATHFMTWAMKEPFPWEDES